MKRIDKEFLDLIKKVADRYGIKVTENADKGGMFFKDRNGNLSEVDIDILLTDVAEFKDNLSGW